MTTSLDLQARQPADFTGPCYVTHESSVLRRGLSSDSNDYDLASRRRSPWNVSIEAIYTSNSMHGNDRAISLAHMTGYIIWSPSRVFPMTFAHPSPFLRTMYTDTDHTPTAATRTIIFDPSLSAQQTQLQDFLETAEGHERFTASLQSADTTEDIQTLSAIIRELKHAFREMGDYLGVLDKKMKRRKFSFLRQAGDTSLRAEWKILHKRFLALLDRSQANAFQASALLKQYTQLFTGAHEQDLQYCNSLKKEIENFMEITKMNIEKATSFRDHFSSLSDDIRLFGMELHGKVESAKERDDSLLRELSEAYAELGKLEHLLGKVSKELLEFSSACLANLAAGAREAGRFFVKFAPNAVHSAMASVFDAVPQGIDAARKRAEVASLQVQIREAQERIAKLRRHRGAVRELTESMQRANVAVDNVSFRIDALSDIWKHLHWDMVELNSMLATVVCGKAVPQLFLRKLSLTPIIYHKLTTALDMYAREAM
ncbi:hypothetical protein GY45DRAFT_1331609 [Cubamyces sp. BRFM 1775]|nr:hypothetical protein GY45DRAFT_1331609 [Cubamyces sp. BRFM 1775]